MRLTRSSFAVTRNADLGPRSVDLIATGMFSSSGQKTASSALDKGWRLFVKYDPHKISFGSRYFIIATSMESVDVRGVDSFLSDVLGFVKFNKLPSSGITLAVAEEFGDEVKDFVVGNPSRGITAKSELLALVATREKRVYFSGQGGIKELAQKYLLFDGWKL